MLLFRSVGHSVVPQCQKLCSLPFETGGEGNRKDSRKSIMNDQKYGKATARGKIQRARILLFGKESWRSMTEVYIITSDTRDRMFIPSYHRRAERASNQPRRSQVLHKQKERVSEMP